jgi:hypothetical protein
VVHRTIGLLFSCALICIHQLASSEHYARKRVFCVCTTTAADAAADYVRFLACSVEIDHTRGARVCAALSRRDGLLTLVSHQFMIRLNFKLYRV